MKNSIRLFVTILVTALGIFAASAKEQLPGTPLVCDTVMQAPNLTADQIYNNVKIWFANNMRSANDVIQLDDISNKHLIGKANIDFKVNNMTWSNLTGVIRFTIDIAARDGRYRVKIFDFTHEAFRDGPKAPYTSMAQIPTSKGCVKSKTQRCRNEHQRFVLII